MIINIFFCQQKTLFIAIQVFLNSFAFRGFQLKFKIKFIEKNEILSNNYGESLKRLNAWQLTSKESLDWEHNPLLPRRHRCHRCKANE